MLVIVLFLLICWLYCYVFRLFGCLAVLLLCCLIDCFICLFVGFRCFFDLELFLCLFVLFV